MAPRNAASGASAVKASGARARHVSTDSQNLAGTLAVLDGYRRDRLLEAVAIAAKELLRSSDLAVSLPKIIELFAGTTGVDRGHIFLVDAANGQGNVLQHSVWTAPGIATPPEFQNAQEPVANIAMKSWIEKFERDETIAGHVRDFDPDKRAFSVSAA